MSEPEIPGTAFDADVQADLVDRSRAFLYNFMNGDGEANLPLFADRIAFVSPSPTQPVYDVDAYLRYSQAVRDEDYRVVLMDQSLTPVPLEPDFCCVLLRCRLFLSMGAGHLKYKGVFVRYFFLWTLRGEGPRLLSVETSYQRTRDEGGSPAERMAEVREAASLDGFLSERLLEFRDDRRVSHFVGADGILYAEARGHKCAIHCVEGTFTVNEGIGAVEERLGPGFVRIHRSYLVNPQHLRTLSDRGATLDDGETLPVPARRIEELRGRLASVWRQENDLAGIDDLLFRGRPGA